MVNNWSVWGFKCLRARSQPSEARHVLKWQCSEVHCSKLTRLLLARGNPPHTPPPPAPVPEHFSCITVWSSPHLCYSIQHTELRHYLSSLSSKQKLPLTKLKKLFLPNVCDPVTEDHRRYRCSEKPPPWAPGARKLCGPVGGALEAPPGVLAKPGSGKEQTRSKQALPLPADKPSPSSCSVPRGRA